MRSSFFLLAAVLAWACSSESPPADVPANDASTAPAKDAGPRAEANASSDAASDAMDAAIAPLPLKGAPPSALPVSYQRPDVGTPLTAAELSTATDELIAILKDTRYFGFVDDRIHGWPESDPAKGYWYSHFWTGITVTKASGRVTYKHPSDGSDNVGIATAPYLEGSCYAYLLWGDSGVGRLVHKMTRAYLAWSLAMVRATGDTSPTLLARSFYRPNVDSTDGGRALTIDYSASYPGIDASPSEYVHLPTNPTFGDIWIKNKRSKDDIGHMLRSLEQSRACAPRLDAAVQADIDQTVTRYKSWATRVDAQNFRIETLDKSQQLWQPSDQLASYSLVGNLECLGAFALRMAGSGVPGSLNCGNGFPSIESLGWSLLKNDARQILRSNQSAAIALSYRAAQLGPALSLLQGLGSRIDLDMSYVESASPPANFNINDVVSELIMATNVGIPLTSREVRFVHDHLHQAYVGVRDPTLAPHFDLFNASTPDGTYSYDPPTIGMFYRDVGMLLGSCASPYRNSSGRPALDCAKLAAAF